MYRTGGHGALTRFDVNVCDIPVHNPRLYS